MVLTKSNTGLAESHTIDKENELYENHIKPTVLNRFPNAKVILLCGSQGRALSNGDHLPQKNSDYDFVVLYDDFEENIASTMFSCEKLYIPEEDRIISIDYKVFDKQGFEDHITDTVQIRRFPFLFNMIDDGHIVQGDGDEIKGLKERSVKIINDGPAELSHRQINEQIEKLKDFLTSCNCISGDSHRRKDAALTAANFLPQSILRLEQQWESGTNRVFQYIQEHNPVMSQKLHDAYKTAIAGDITDMQQIASDLLDKYEEKLQFCQQDNEPAPQACNTEYLEQVKKQSDQNLCRIMIDQYLDRLEVAYLRGEGYELGTQASLWSTLKQMTKLMGTDQDEKHQTALRRTLSTIVDKDYHNARDLADFLLQPVGGLDFDYLERPYTDDLAKRLSAKQDTFVGPLPIKRTI